MNTTQDVFDTAVTFLQKYHAEDVAKLTYDRETIWIDHNDLFAFDADLAEDVLANPRELIRVFEDAVGEVDTSTADAPDFAPVRFFNVGGADTFAPGEIRSEHGERLVSIQGTLERVTTTSDVPKEVCFVCQRCGTPTFIPQEIASSDLQEPHECSGCERQGPF